MGKHSKSKESIRRASRERWKQRWGKIKEWYFTAGTGERRSTSGQPDSTDDGVGRASIIRGELSPQVSPKGRAARKAAITATILIARAKTYFWEEKVFKGYWDAWVNTNPGATEEFATLLHGIPRVKNND